MFIDPSNVLHFNRVSSHNANDENDVCDQEDKSCSSRLNKIDSKTGWTFERIDRD